MLKIDGRYLRKLRKDHGYSLREFAKLVYASKSSVQRWEASFAPEDKELLEKIAAVYSTTVDDLRKQSQKEYAKKSYPPKLFLEVGLGIGFITVLILLIAAFFIVLKFI